MFNHIPNFSAEITDICAILPALYVLYNSVPFVNLVKMFLYSCWSVCLLALTKFRLDFTKRGLWSLVFDVTDFRMKSMDRIFG